MAKDKFEEKKITTRAEDYSEWYLDVIREADLAEHSPVRGCMIIKPNGYSLWEKVQRVLDDEFKKSGVQNLYFPMLIPHSFLTKEAEHVEGFSPELAMVTHAGGKDLEEPLVLRPTSETIMYDTFSRWISSYRDLPLLVNQWANVIRWELRTRLFLRTTEFLWQEGHTVHATEVEADDRARMMLEVYRKFAEEYMAIPAIVGQKSESEKFAGALKTYSVEAIMQDGKALQFATSHNLGQNFSNAFEIKYLNKENILEHAWQTSWGLSTRVIGGLIMTHSDDKGLVLPPKMAATQVVFVPIYKNEEEMAKVKEFVDRATTELESINIRTRADYRDLRPGEKYFDWEKKGIPVRVEIGPRDIVEGSAIIVRRDTSEKTKVAFEDFVESVKTMLENIQETLLENAIKYREAKKKNVDTWDEFKTEIEAGNIVLAHWSGDREIEAKIKEETGATVRCIPFDQLEEEGVCVYSGEPSKKRVLFAKSY